MDKTQWHLKGVRLELICNGMSTSILSHPTWAGQMASHSLQAIHLSSPEGYLLNACSPRKRGLSGPFSKG